MNWSKAGTVALVFLVAAGMAYGGLPENELKMFPPIAKPIVAVATMGLYAVEKFFQIHKSREGGKDGA